MMVYAEEATLHTIAVMMMIDDDDYSSSSRTVLLSTKLCINAENGANSEDNYLT